MHVNKMVFLALQYHDKIFLIGELMYVFYLIYKKELKKLDRLILIIPVIVFT
jgi:hypothetical protein